MPKSPQPLLSKLAEIREKEHGFTLIELLVVILVIGILASVAIPVFLNQRKNANESAVKSDLTNAAKVFETELVANKGRSYPTVMPTSVKTSEGVTLSLPAVTPPDGYVDVKAVSHGSNIPYTLKFRDHAAGAELKLYYNELPWNSTLHLRHTSKCTNGTIVETHTMPASFQILKGTSTGTYVLNTPCSWRYTKIPGSSVITASTSTTKSYGHLYAEGTTSLPDYSNITPGPTPGFCINGTHSNINGKTFKYDSLTGGLQEGTCTP